jgi:DNA-binding response OmpR family regulator
LRLKDGLAWDLLAKIREHHAIPGVLTSGYAEEAYVRKSKENGFDEYLVKPVDPDNLLAVVRHHVGALTGARL